MHAYHSGDHSREPLPEPATGSGRVSQRSTDRAALPARLSHSTEMSRWEALSLPRGGSRGPRTERQRPRSPSDGGSSRAHRHRPLQGDRSAIRLALPSCRRYASSGREGGPQLRATSGDGRSSAGQSAASTASSSVSLGRARAPAKCRSSARARCPHAVACAAPKSGPGEEDGRGSSHWGCHDRVVALVCEDPVVIASIARLRAWNLSGRGTQVHARIGDFDEEDPRSRVPAVRLTVRDEVRFGRAVVVSGTVEMQGRAGARRRPRCAQPRPAAHEGPGSPRWLAG
jgi:hypothetical protein